MAAVAGKCTHLAPGFPPRNCPAVCPPSHAPPPVPQFPRRQKPGPCRSTGDTPASGTRSAPEPPSPAGRQASSDPAPPPPRGAPQGGGGAGRAAGRLRGAPAGGRGGAGGGDAARLPLPRLLPPPPPSWSAAPEEGRRQAPGAARGAAAAAAAAPWSPSERARARPAPDNMEAAPPRLLLLALCSSLAPAAGRWAPAAGTMARRPSARRAEATLQVGGELGRAPRVPAAPPCPAPSRGEVTAHGPFVSPARAPPGKAGPRPAPRAGEESARAAPTPPGAARAGPHLPAARGALRSAAACGRPGEAARGPWGPRAAGRRRAGTFGPETGLAALRRGLFLEPVSDGRAAGLPAPRTDLSCGESSQIGRRRPGLSRGPLPSARLSASERTDTCQVPGGPVSPPGPPPPPSTPRWHRAGVHARGVSWGRRAG